MSIDVTLPTGVRTKSDHAIKRSRLLDILTHTPNAASIVLTSSGATAWYLEGARTHVSVVGDPIAAVVVTREAEWVFAFESEAERLAAEELPENLEVVAVPWHAPLLPDEFRSSVPGVLHESDIAQQLRAARACLLPDELHRYRQLCGDAAAVLTDVLEHVGPATSERDVTSRIGARLAALGCDPIVLLAAGRDRLNYRHPLPTPGPLGDRAVVVVCARRHGLIANLTRWVQFGTERTDDLDRDRRIREVESDFLGLTRPGVAVREVFERAVGAYARNGFSVDEWRRHHQGGPAGYFGRDPRATLEVHDLVQLGQVFSWNPTAPGTKIEDTVLVEETGVSILTIDPRWPTTTVSGLERPLPLVLP